MIIGGPYDLVISPAGRARFKGRCFTCSLGVTGVSNAKREGDGATPSGIFRLEGLFYRADRGSAPRSCTPNRFIRTEDGWCDAVESSAYNSWVRLPYPHSAEKLRRPDRLYDIIGVLDANRAPIICGAGSAIFLHVARRARFPTLGCIAFAEKDLRWILARWTPRSRVVVKAAHAGFWRAPKTPDPTRTDVAPRAMAVS